MLDSMVRALSFAFVVLASCAHTKAVAPVAAAEVAPPPTIRVAPPPPKEDVDFAVRGALGAISESDIADAFTTSWPSITRCYRHAQQQHHYVGGSLKMRVRVDHAGAPQSVFITASDIGNYGLEQCIAKTVLEMAFTEPKGGDTAEFQFPLSFKTSGHVTVANVEALSKYWQVAAKSCALKHPAPDSLDVTIYVLPGGRVTSAGLSSDDAIDPKYGQCVVDAALKWRADPPRSRVAKLHLALKRSQQVAAR